MKKIFIALLFGSSLYALDTMISPLPDSLPFDRDKALLGKALYMDASLSKDGKVSCNSCHNVASYGVDNKIFSDGVDGIEDSPFNSPSSFNAVFNFVQFWNGRATSLEEQAQGPFFNPKEMGLTKEELLQKVRLNAGYVDKFDKIYGKISVANIANAIAEYEKTLITPNSPFDRYLKGEEGAISEQAKRGYAAFKSNGCIACHQGQNIGGSMYQKIGIFQPYPNQENLGRYELTKNEADKMFFKVPSLRNVAKTGPYLHDGSIPTLDACVQFMAYYQLGKFLSPETTADIVAFLESLTGVFNEKL